MRDDAQGSSRDASGSQARFMLSVGAMLIGVYGIWLLVAWPSGEFPLNDDWAYAWSVRHLLGTGELRVSEWSSAAALLQVAWGSLFAKASGGFSFESLRVSTLVFSIVSPLALCLLLRRLGISRAAAALGALVVVANPIFVNLSYTFMTDVFYLGLMLVSLALYVDGIERDSARMLWAASIAAAAAFLCRQLGLALPAAAALVLIARHRSDASRAVLRAVLIPALVFVLYTLWLREVHGVPWGFRVNVVQNGIANLVRTSAPLELWVRLLYVLLYLGIFSLPAMIAVAASGHFTASRARALGERFLFWLALLAGATAYAYAENGMLMPYLGGVITRDGIGGVTLGGHKPPATPVWLFGVVSFVAPFAGAVLGAVWTDALRNFRREVAGRGGVVILATLLMAALTGPMVVLWDEYLLVFVPASLYLLLREAPVSVRGWGAGALVCAAMLAYVLPEQAECLAWNDARWRLGRQLVDAGASPQEIHGGFEWVGWHDFEQALPQSIAAGRGDDLYAWIAVFPDRYFMAFQPMGVDQGRSRVVSEVRYQTRFGPGGEIYAVEDAKR
jgi:hypothetical protein